MDTAPRSSRSVSSAVASPRLGVGPLGIGVRVVVAIGILVVANLLAGSVPALVILLPGAGELFGGASPSGVMLGITIQALVLAVVVLSVGGWMRWVERAPIRAAGWRWTRSSGLWLLLGVLTAAGTVLAVIALLPATGPLRDETMLPGGRDASPAMTALLIVFYLGLAFAQQSIPEEILFRGMLLWRLRERPVRAVIVTTAAFTVIHLVSQSGAGSVGEQVLYLAMPFGFSLLAVGLLLWTGSLWAAVGVHGGFHVGNYLAAISLQPVDVVTSWLAIGGGQATLGLILIITALRSGRRILDGES